MTPVNMLVDLQRLCNVAIAVEDYNDEALHAVVLSECNSHRSVVALVVDVDTQDDGRVPVVLIRETRK